MPREELAVFLGFYNDAIAMKRCLNGLIAHGIPKVYCPDGRACLFDGDVNVSTDGSHELVNSYNNTELIVWDDRPCMEIRDKINYVCKKAGEDGYKWLLVLGCDEWIEGDVDNLVDIATIVNEEMPNEHLFNLRFKDHSPASLYSRGEEMYLPRLMHDPGHFETRYTHWLRYYKGERVDANLNLQTVVIHHDDSIRPAWRNKLMDSYQEKNVMKERNNLMESLGISEIEAMKETYFIAHCNKCRILKAYIMGRCVGCNEEFAIIER